MNQKLTRRICGPAAVSAGLVFSMMFAASCDDTDDVQNADGGLGQIDVGVPDTASAPDAMGRPDAMPVNDAEIVGAMATVNQGEIDQGMLAAMKAQTMAVRAFGNMMVMHHRTALNRASAVATAAGLAPAPSPIEQMLQTNNAAKLMELKLVNPPAFDVLYMEGQVKAHRDVLNLLDTTFIPQAKNASLRADLMVARGEVAMHLGEAQQLRISLGSLSPSPDGGVDSGNDGAADR